MIGSNLWSDGNALAGPLQDVFRVDVTTAVGRCTACGRTAPMAEVRVSQVDVEHPSMGVRGPSAAPECGERRQLDAGDALTCRYGGGGEGI
jgi:hypothetical protein